MAFGMKDIMGLLGPMPLAKPAMKYGGKAFNAMGGMDALFGTSPQQQRTPIYNEQQEGALDQLLQQGMGSIGGTGMRDLAMKRFQEETIPSIAERFTSMGGSGGQRSSAFQSSLGRAGGDLEAQLAALGQQQGMQQVGMGLMPRHQLSETEGQKGLLGGGGGQMMAQILPILLKLLSGGF